MSAMPTTGRSSAAWIPATTSGGEPTRRGRRPSSPPSARTAAGSDGSVNVALTAEDDVAARLQKARCDAQPATARGTGGRIGAAESAMLWRAPGSAGGSRVDLRGRRPFVPVRPTPGQSPERCACVRAKSNANGPGRMPRPVGRAGGPQRAARAGARRPATAAGLRTRPRTAGARRPPGRQSSTNPVVLRDRERRTRAERAEKRFDRRLRGFARARGGQAAPSTEDGDKQSRGCGEGTARGSTGGSTGSRRGRVTRRKHTIDDPKLLRLLREKRRREQLGLPEPKQPFITDLQPWQQDAWERCYAEERRRIAKTPSATDTSVPINFPNRRHVPFVELQRKERAGSSRRRTPLCLPRSRGPQASTAAAVYSPSPGIVVTSRGDTRSTFTIARTTRLRRLEERGRAVAAGRAPPRGASPTCGRGSRTWERCYAEERRRIAKTPSIRTRRCPSISRTAGTCHLSSQPQGRTRVIAQEDAVTFASIERARQVYEMPAVYSPSPGVVVTSRGDTRIDNRNHKADWLLLRPKLRPYEHAATGRMGIPSRARRPMGISCSETISFHPTLIQA